MKKLIAFFILVSSITLIAQLKSVGLQGMNIYSLALYGNAIYAGTDDGVYFITPVLSYWQPLAFQGKKIKSIYPHQYGPVGSAVTVSVLRDSVSSTEPLIYCSCDQNEWVVQDSGIDRTGILYIKGLDGFPSIIVCGETFAGGFGKLFLRNDMSNFWGQVFDIGIGQLNVVKTNRQSGEVWIGGETGIFAPYISKSEDKGKTWSTVYPDLDGDNACNSILLDDTDTTIVYAGMEGAVIKSKDKGKTWKPTGLNGTPYYFYAMAKDYVTNTIFAGGSTNTNEMGLYKSSDAGGTWQQIVPVPTVMLKGISSLLVVVSNWCCEADLYIGTLGDGIYTYHLELTDTQPEKNSNRLQFYLSQN